MEENVRAKHYALSAEDSPSNLWKIGEIEDLQLFNIRLNSRQENQTCEQRFNLICIYYKRSQRNICCNQSYHVCIVAKSDSCGL